MPESKSGALPLGDIPMWRGPLLIGHTGYYSMGFRILQSFFCEFWGWEDLFLKNPLICAVVLDQGICCAVFFQVSEKKNVRTAGQKVEGQQKGGGKGEPMRAERGKSQKDTKNR